MGTSVNMSTSMNISGIASFSICAVIGIGISIWLIIINTPRKKAVEKKYQQAMIDFKEYFFYFQKATAYRKLHTSFLALNYSFRTINIISTMILVYNVFHSKLDVLVALVSAISEVMILLFQFEKKSRMYLYCATILEDVLHKQYSFLRKQRIKTELLKAYLKAEKHIEQTMYE